VWTSRAEQTRGEDLKINCTYSSVCGLPEVEFDPPPCLENYRVESESFRVVLELMSHLG
jgi:hypothetical protein